MKQRWALAALVLALSAVPPRVLAAQGSTQSGQERSAGLALRQNYPNPVDTATRISFTIGEAGCTDQGRTYRVTLAIYDIFSKMVAFATLQGGSGGAGGDALENLQLTCNTYTAYWDAKSKRTSQRVPSGVYYYRLHVDSKAPLTRKMLVK
jgi:hypothetical protein